MTEQVTTLSVIIPTLNETGQIEDVLGYGNPINAKKWWLDLEVMGDKTFKYDPKNYTVAAITWVMLSDTARVPVAA